MGSVVVAVIGMREMEGVRGREAVKARCWRVCEGISIVIADVA